MPLDFRAVSVMTNAYATWVVGHPITRRPVRDAPVRKAVWGKNGKFGKAEGWDEVARKLEGPLGRCRFALNSGSFMFFPICSDGNQSGQEKVWGKVR